LEPELEELKNKKLYEIYQQYSGRVDEKLFVNPFGIHGVLHSKRVLLINLLISNRLAVSREDTLLLAEASAYHDIGRRQDGACTVHGLLSFRKAKRLGLIRLESVEDLNILKFIIENHCIDDTSALKQINSYNIENKERAIFLFNIFKDSDNLDRVRLGDLDVSYLRNETSKEMVPLALYLYKSGNSLDKVWTC